MDYDAEKSINIAKSAMKDGDYNKAKRFLLKSMKIQQTTEAQSLLTICEKYLAENPNGCPRQKDAKEKIPNQEESTKDNSKSSSNNDEALCKEILGKNDYYEIIGVPKTATEEEIKKKYKRLALKLHPDKNHSPQATEAFKKVTQAFSCLSNKEKRKIYDQHGTEDNFRQRYHSYFRDEEQLNPEDIFNMFFGGMGEMGSFGVFGFDGINEFTTRRTRRGGPRVQHFYFSTDGRQQGRRAQQNIPEERGGFRMYLPILIMAVAMLFMVYFQINSYTSYSDYTNAFSLEKGFTYSVLRITKRARVEYYVKKTFKSVYGYDRKSIDKVENEVEKMYYKKMSDKCDIFKKNKKELTAKYNSYTYNKKEQKRINEEISQLDYSSCEEYDRLKDIFSG